MVFVSGGWYLERMFGSEFGQWRGQVEPLEARVSELEGIINRCRAEQAAILSILDGHQVDWGEGDRGMEDWTSRHLDVSPQTAHRLMVLAKQPDSPWLQHTHQGQMGLDRVCFLLKLEQAGAPPEIVEGAAAGYSLGKLWGLVEQYRQIPTQVEQASFDSRYLYLQPLLDQSAFKVSGLLYGADAETVDKALRTRANQFPVLPDPPSQGQLLADALTSICADSLTASSEPDREPKRAVTVAEVFIDAALAVPSQGQTGAGTTNGLRVGPETLFEILCDGKIRVVYTDGDQGPIATTHLTDSIPPPIRAYIWKRDMGQCSIDGCRSRHRLQIHHLRERSQGGDHHPSNLVLICWYHHHIAIHMLGFRIDPNSPTHRRTLLHPWHHRTPPAAALA